MLVFQFQPGIFPGFKLPVSNCQNFTSFKTEIFPGSNPGLPTWDFFRFKCGSITLIFRFQPWLSAIWEQLSNFDFTETEKKFETWDFSRFETLIWNGSYETVKISGLIKPEIFPGLKQTWIWNSPISGSL